jgi:hypothetical protein
VSQESAQTAGVAAGALPTFIIAGAGKSGSTSLFEYLRQHPQVCMSPMKEPRFFSRALGFEDDGPVDGPTRSGRFDEGREWYSQLFSACGERRARGEATMMYFFAEDSPGLIRSVIPDVRLVFLLRAPVARAYAQYWGERRHGWRLPPFEEMIRTNHPRARRYLDTSHYEVHLDRFFALFDASQVHVELFDDLVSAPRDVFARVCAHIGVDAGIGPGENPVAHNRGGQPRFGAVQRMLRTVRRARAQELVPSSLRPALGKLSRALTHANTRNSGYPPMEAGLRRQLTAQFEGDVAYVERLLGRSLPQWRA